MRHAQNRRLRQPFDERIVDMRFVFRIERAGGFVEEQKSGLCSSTRAAASRCCSPGDRHRVQCAISSSRSAYASRLQRRSASRDSSSLNVPPATDTTSAAAQRADRQIAHLRDEHHACVDRARRWCRRRTATSPASARISVLLPEPGRPDAPASASPARSTTFAHARRAACRWAARA